MVYLPLLPGGSLIDPVDPGVPEPLRWYTQILEDPPFHLPYIPIYSLNFMKHNGFIARADSKGKFCEKWFVEPNFDEYCRRNKVIFDPRAFNIIRDTFDGVNSSVLKYNIPDFAPQYSAYELDLAKQWMYRFFEPMRGTIPIIAKGQVMIDPANSCGPVYQWLKDENKGISVHAHPVLHDWFWLHAHIRKYPVLWKQSGKVELVKRAKLDKNDIRGFTICPIDFFLAKARMCQPFNKAFNQLHTLPNNWIKVGLTIQYGGISRFATYLDPTFLKFSSDLDKMDSRVYRFFFDVCREIREYCWDGKGMSKEEFKDRMVYLYDQTIHSYILLPTGQVVEKFVGNPSGDVNTTTDNTMSHLFACFLHWISTCNHSYDSMMENWLNGLYSDDQVGGVPAKYAPNFTFEARKASYDKVGWKLSVEKDICSHNIVGHTFLGKEIGIEHGVLVPKVKYDKILCSLRNLEGRLPLPIIYARALALMVESTFTYPLYFVVRGFCEQLSRRTAVSEEDDTVIMRWLSSFPTHEQLKNFWLGSQPVEYPLGIGQQPLVAVSGC